METIYYIRPTLLALGLTYLRALQHSPVQKKKKKKLVLTPE